MDTLFIESKTPYQIYETSDFQNNIYFYTQKIMSEIVSIYQKLDMHQLNIIPFDLDDLQMIRDDIFLLRQAYLQVNAAYYYNTVWTGIDNIHELIKNEEFLVVMTQIIKFFIQIPKDTILIVCSGNIEFVSFELFFTNLDKSTCDNLRELKTFIKQQMPTVMISVKKYDKINTTNDNYINMID